MDASGDSWFLVTEFVVFELLVFVEKLLFVAVVVTEGELECDDCAENDIFGVCDWTGDNGSWFCC